MAIADTQDLIAQHLYVRTCHRPTGSPYSPENNLEKPVPRSSSKQARSYARFEPEPTESCLGTAIAKFWEKLMWAEATHDSRMYTHSLDPP